MGRGPRHLDCRTAALDQTPPATRPPCLRRFEPRAGDRGGRGTAGRGGARMAARARPERPSPASAQAIEEPAPDEEVATITLDPQTAVYVSAHGRLIAAVELISPRNKDRTSARGTYLTRYLSYLQEGAHLLLVDVHPRPYGFSFADALAEELGIRQPPCAAPLANSYRVGEPAPEGGRFVAIWRRSLAVGEPLPTVPLPLAVGLSIPVNLDETYRRAAADAYLA